MTGGLSDTDVEAVGEAFDELETVVQHLDAMEECGPLFGRAKQELEADGTLGDRTRDAFVDRVIDLYGRARKARERAEQDEAEAEADAYHRDTAALLNAISMLAFIEPGLEREALMARVEDAHERAD